MYMLHSVHCIVYGVQPTHPLRVSGFLGKGDSMFLKTLTFIIMISGMVGSLMLAHAIWEGYYFFLAASSIGAYWCYCKQAWPLMCLDLFYTVANCLGIWNQIINGGG